MVEVPKVKLIAQKRWRLVKHLQLKIKAWKLTQGAPWDRITSCVDLCVRLEWRELPGKVGNAGGDRVEADDEAESGRGGSFA